MKRTLAKILSNGWAQRGLLILFVMIIMALFQPKFFLMSNVRSIMIAISIYGIMACGMLVVIVVGGIDLCIGSTAALGACIMTLVYNAGNHSNKAFLLAMLCAFGACLLLGLFHGVLVACLRLQPFVVTFATQTAIYGTVIAITKGQYLSPSYEGLYYKIANGTLFGIPMVIMWFLVFIAISAFVLSCTPFGRRSYFCGGNREAGEIVGISTRGYMIISYVMSSLFACIGGIILSSLNMQAYFTTASGYEGKVLTAMIVGGVSLDGGGGNILQAAFGALFVGIINNILILLSVPSDYQVFAQGVIIITAIALNTFTGELSMKALNRVATQARAAMPQENQHP